jgi:hypothetical protein
MYYPQAGEEGFGLLKAALRDYLRDNTLVNPKTGALLPNVVELLPGGQAAGFIDEGFLKEDTKTPVVMFSTVGDGQSERVREDTLVRLILYVIDRGRGLYSIERILHRMRRRLNATEATLQYLTFPKSTGLVVTHIEASGSTSSVSLPAWKAEARAVYVFLTVKGLEADF